MCCFVKDYESYTEAFLIGQPVAIAVHLSSGGERGVGAGGVPGGWREGYIEGPAVYSQRSACPASGRCARTPDCRTASSSSRMRPARPADRNTRTSLQTDQPINCQLRSAVHSLHCGPWSTATACRLQGLVGCRQ